MKINLEEIFLNNFDCYTECVCDIEYPAMSKEKFVEQTKLIVRQILELAAENAYARDFIEGSTTTPALTPNIDIIVNKQSILDTINNIE